MRAVVFFVGGGGRKKKEGRSTRYVYACCVCASQASGCGRGPIEREVEAKGDHSKAKREGGREGVGSGEVGCVWVQLCAPVNGRWLAPFLPAPAAQSTCEIQGVRLWVEGRVWRQRWPHARARAWAPSPSRAPSSVGFFSLSQRSHGASDHLKAGTRLQCTQTTHRTCAKMVAGGASAEGKRLGENLCRHRASPLRHSVFCVLCCRARVRAL